MQVTHSELRCYLSKKMSELNCQHTAKAMGGKRDKVLEQRLVKASLVKFAIDNRTLDAPDREVWYNYLKQL